MIFLLKFLCNHQDQEDTPSIRNILLDVRGTIFYLLPFSFPLSKEEQLFFFFFIIIDLKSGLNLFFNKFFS